MDPALERYSRQIKFHGIGEEGQTSLSRSRVLLCGCGALGSALADTLVRAGVGFVRIVDRDFVELSNLQRQVLFDETDIAAALPKAEAAARKLRRINSQVEIEPVVCDLNHTNILDLARDVDLILDGMDNFETRYLINDASLELKTPWVFGGCIGSHGQVMTIIPGETGCLQCLMETPPGPAAGETCDTAGVLSTAIHVVAAMQATNALKLLAGRREAVSETLLIIDVWDGVFRPMSIAGLRDKANCPACQQGQRYWLSGERAAQSVILCGRNAVQISPPERHQLNLADLKTRLESLGEVSQNSFLLRLKPRAEDVILTVFPDGRAIIQGTSDVAVAKGIYTRYLGI